MNVKKQRKLHNFIVIFLIISAGAFFHACFNDSESGSSINGKITYNGHADSAYYIILDDDTDESNGYIKRAIINPTTDVSSVSYEIDTGDVPQGSYYLLSGWDSYSLDNMDPDNSSKWEAKAWYGGSTSYPVTPPSAPNITHLSMKYNITLIGLP
jgi:hypothetical protein